MNFKRCCEYFTNLILIDFILFKVKNRLNKNAMNDLCKMYHLKIHFYRPVNLSPNIFLESFVIFNSL